VVEPCVEDPGAAVVGTFEDVFRMWSEVLLDEKATAPNPKRIKAPNANAAIEDVFICNISFTTLFIFFSFELSF
jgi:hypothetical protein